MTEEARKARNAYNREWARRNRDKVKAAQERFWAKKIAIAAAAEEETKNEAGKDNTLSLQA